MLRHLAVGLTLAATTILGLAVFHTPSASAATGNTYCGQRVGQTPAIKHVIVIMEENRSYSHIIAAPGTSTYKAMPFMNGTLAPDCGLATNFHNATHLSDPNYIAVTSGTFSWGKTSVKSIYSQTSWNEFNESMKTPCRTTTDPGDKPYDTNHNAAIKYSSLTSAQCQANNLDLGTTSSGNLASELANKTLPSFTLIDPNSCDDMHYSCSSTTLPTTIADNWLKSWITTIVQSPAYADGSTAVFITWDEGWGAYSKGAFDQYATPVTGEHCYDNSTDESCHIATFVISPYTTPGTRSSAFFNTYSILKTAEQMFNLPYLGGAASANSMGSAFNLGGSGGTQPVLPAAPTLTAQPANPTTSTAPSFSFTDSTSGVTYQCKLDSGAYSSCTSPNAYSGLADGSHTFSVEATNSVGTSAATSYTWSIQTSVQAPAMPTITSEPANGSGDISPTFAFSDSVSGVSFECMMDGGVFAACTSPNTFGTLDYGSHTFEVRATNSAGTSAAATYTWHLDDTTPPSQVTGMTDDTASGGDPSFHWTAATDAGFGQVVSYNVYRDGAQIGNTTKTSFDDSGLGAAALDGSFTDLFTTNASNGWGSNYTYQHTATNMAVSGGQGSILLKGANQSQQATEKSPASDVTSIAKFELSALPVGGSLRVVLPVRAADGTDTGNAYRPYLEISPKGAMSLGASLVSGGKLSTLNAGTPISGTFKANTWYKMRITTSGSAPTRINVTVWLASASQGPPQLTMNNSTAGVQGSGLSAIRLTSLSGMTNTVTLNVDLFQVIGGTSTSHDYTVRAVDGAGNLGPASAPLSISH